MKKVYTFLKKVFGTLSRKKADTANKHCFKPFKRDLGCDRSVEHPNHKWQEQEQAGAADPVKYRNPPSWWQSIAGQIVEGIYISEFRALGLAAG